jgi:hypothetical protein
VLDSEAELASAHAFEAACWRVHLGMDVAAACTGAGFAVASVPIVVAAPAVVSSPEAAARVSDAPHPTPAVRRRVFRASARASHADVDAALRGFGIGTYDPRTGQSS